jgi:hypothetical protein
MSEPAAVYVPVITMDAGREITWRADVSEMLTTRLDDIRNAIRAGAVSVSAGPTDLPAPDDWRVSEVTASFGITLAAEAGVILSKASTEATFDVTITFTRRTGEAATNSPGDVG